MHPIFELSNSFGIKSDKPYFPVNSLRLLYFIIGSYFSGHNQEVLQKISSLIPKVEAVFTARSEHRGSTETPTAQSDRTAAEAAVNEVIALIDTPTVRQSFARLFSYTYPLQDELFLHLYQSITTEKPLTTQDLSLLLHVRAMDSEIFATLLTELLTPFLKKDASFSLDVLSASIQWHVHLAYQLNDIVDTVVYAKDDLEANSFSPFQVIRKIAPEPAAAKELITTTLNELKGRAKVFAFPTACQQDVEAFYSALVEVVHT